MTAPETWLSGPVAGVPALLQPVAHALIQAREEVRRIVWELPDDALWERPAGMASAGFHLQHLTGVVDRLFTYARGESLNEAQLTALSSEGEPPIPPLTPRALGLVFDAQVEAALIQLRSTPEAGLTSPRTVGRTGLPSTHVGLLVHSAEHTMRHVGQLMVTARVVTAGRPRAR